MDRYIYIYMYLRPRGLRSFARCWSHSVLAYRFMRCASCHTWEGSPTCQVCRTLRRIRELIEGQLLLRRQESQVLTVLRDCAGALTDLAEEAAPILAQELRESGPEVATKEAVDGEPLAPGVEEKDKDEPKKETVEVKKEDQGEQQLNKEPLVTVPIAAESKEGKKDQPQEKRKRRRKHKAGTSSKREGKKSRREKKKKEKEEEPKAEVGHQEPTPILAKGSSARGLDPTPQDLERDPSRYGLRPAVWGTVAKHFNPPLPPPPPAPRYPAEPSYPPTHYQGNSTGRERSSWRRPRSRSPRRTDGQPRRRGSKGVKHRERGRYWPHRR